MIIEMYRTVCLLKVQNNGNNIYLLFVILMLDFTPLTNIYYWLYMNHFSAKWNEGKHVEINNSFFSSSK